jgi:hypothetical protein
MPKRISFFRILLILFSLTIFSSSGCAPAKKNPFYDKKKQASKVNTTQLGRNKYYFSTGYQKKLTKGYKK